MSYRSSRFVSPSSALRLRALVRNTRQGLWTGLAVTLAVHLSFTQVRLLRPEQKAAKPLTTRFVKRQPRLTKPLEMRKHPIPKRRRVQRRMVAVQAKAGRHQPTSGIRPLEMLGRLARPSASVSRIGWSIASDLEPHTLSRPVLGTREVGNQVDMSLELMDIEALDTGQYHALVVSDPEDRQNIQGFCHLAIVYSRSLYPPPPAGLYYAFENIVLPGFLRIAVAMNQYTDIETDILGRLSLDDVEIFKAPWLLVHGLWSGGNSWMGFKLTSGELETLGRYLTSGGFVFADCDNNWVNRITPSYKALEYGLLQALATQRIEARFERLPANHAIYHCYFDFDGPPVGGDAADRHSYGDIARVLRHTEGLTVDGRLVVLLSGKNYVGAWTFFGQRGTWEGWDPRRAFQFAVNTIVFALTQEGSITHRVMNTVRY